MRVSSAVALARPRAATMPNSAACPRSALTNWVRCLTSSSRTVSAIACACASADFTGTKRMLGRDAASLIASASIPSFLPRLTKGLTYCGGISRTRWPSAISSRPQWCDPPHASSTTSHGASLAKNARNWCRFRSRRSTTRSCWSTPCSVKTFLDVSTAMRLISMTDGSFCLRSTTKQFGTRCRGAVHPNTSSRAKIFGV